MKALTLNTHSFMEENYEDKIEYLVNAIVDEEIDVVALQEVNQSIEAEYVPYCELLKSGFVGDSNSCIKRDNFALKIIEILEQRQLYFNWCFIPNHIGYDKFDEGVALLTKYDVKNVTEFYISKNREYNNYKTRKVLGLHTLDPNGKERIFFSIHMGWWNDKTDPFAKQWEALEKQLKDYMNYNVYLMGDFNVSAQTSNEGYDLIKNSNQWYDTYVLAKTKDDGNTVEKLIDGWKNMSQLDKMRIDFIFKNNKDEVKFSKVIFNGKNYPIVSDHFGILISE